MNKPQDFKDIVAKAEAQGASVESAGAARVKDFFKGVMDAGRKVNQAVKIGIGFATKPELRSAVGQFAQEKIEQGGQAVEDAIDAVGNTCEQASDQVIAKVQDGWRRFDQEHVQPLDQSLQQVGAIITGTVTQLPGFAVEQAKQYALRTQTYVEGEATKLRNNIDQVTNIVAAVITDLPGEVYHELEAAVVKRKQENEKKKMLRLAAKTEKKAARIEVRAQREYEKKVLRPQQRYMEAMQKAVALRDQAQQHRQQAFGAIDVTAQLRVDSMVAVG